VHPGFDVIIKIFSDVYQFSAKKMAFLSKTHVMIFLISSSSSKKRHFLGDDILKIITSVYGSLLLGSRHTFVKQKGTPVVPSL
jgi:hypothetical protein